MKNSFIYKFLEAYPLDSYKAKTTTEGRAYFFHPISPSSTSLLISDVEYRIVEQHLSVYEKYQDNKAGFEAYHVTVCLKHGDTRVVFHGYFNQQGTLCGVTLKSKDGSFITLPDADRRLLENYASQASSIIHDLNNQISNKQIELQQIINTKQTHAEEFSKNLKHNLKPYIAQLREIIHVLKKLNTVTNQSLLGKQKLLENMLALCEARLAKETRGKKSVSAKSEAKAISTSILDVEIPAVSVSTIPAVLKDESEKLSDIESKLAGLTEQNNLFSLQMRKKLLESKLSLLPEVNFENRMSVYQQLNNLEAEIPKQYFALALQGDLDAAHVIVENNYSIPYLFYFQLIYHGQAEVFAFIFEHTPTYLTGAISLDESQGFEQKDSCYGIRNLLEVAYHRKHQHLFRDLLLKYGLNPNLSNISGLRLIHEIALSKDSQAIDYLRIMIEARADLNAIVQKPSAVLAATSKTSLTFRERKAFSQNLKKSATKTIEDSISEHEGRTPLMLAALFKRSRIVDYLLEQKADPTIRESKDLNALSIMTARVENISLNPYIILALLNAGLSIDELNNIDIGEQANPLFYRCQWQDKEGVALLVSQFAADPNALMANRIPTAYVLVCPFFKAVTIAKDAVAVTTDAVEIVRFLLDQDIRPLIMPSLVQSMNLLCPDEVTAEAEDKANYIDQRKYLIYAKRREGARQSLTPLCRDVGINITKLTLIKAAEADLTAGRYSDCLAACKAVTAAEFKINQYDERLWAARSHAYLGLADYTNACDALKCYLTILHKKFEQVQAPKFKIQTQEKIEKATTLLAETQQKLLPSASSVVTVASTITTSFMSENKAASSHRSNPIEAGVVTMPFFKDSAQVEIAKRELVIRRRRDDSEDYGGAFGHRHKI